MSPLDTNSCRTKLLLKYKQQCRLTMHRNIYKTMFIVLLSTVKCSRIPGSQHQGDSQLFPLASDRSVAETSAEQIETEYDNDDDDEFLDYYHTARDLNDNSQEFGESWPKELFGSLTENGTILEEIHESSFSEDNDGKTDNIGENELYNDTHFHAAVENTPEDQQALLRQLRYSLNLGTVTNTASDGQHPMIPPQFMTDLYRAVTDPQSGITIRTNPHGAAEVQSILETNPSVAGLFQFDLSNLRYDELVEAELHVYRIGFATSLATNRQPYYLLRVYQVMPTPKNALSQHPDVHQLLNVHYVSAFGTGWQVFKVTRGVDSWQNGTSPNLGLLVTATTILNEPVDVRFSRKHQNSDNFQPSLILFTNHVTNGKTVAGYNRQRPTVSQDEFTSVTDNCRPKPLYVDFASIGWSTFIVSPIGFAAYQCTGACNWPMTAGHNATNHALVRTVLSHNGYDTNVASCVPTELDPISVLYKDDNGNFMLRRLDNMVVRKCACR